MTKKQLMENLSGILARLRRMDVPDETEVTIRGNLLECNDAFGYSMRNADTGELIAARAMVFRNTGKAR